MNGKNLIPGLLALIALLLAANLAGTLLRPGGEARGSFLPAAHAGQFVDTERPYLVTTNQDGDVLHIWVLGRWVGDGYESVRVRSFPADQARGRF